MTTRELAIVSSMSGATWRLRTWIGLLLAAIAWGVYAYAYQLRHGLIATGLRDQVSWGLYISTFVFWVGVSKGGTLISAIFRLTGAEWRRPITRMAEAITVLALLAGLPMILADLGRPDRLLNLVRYGRIQSPLIWDFLSVVTYLTACIIYFYLPLIPDVALLAHQPGIRPWRRRVYTWLAIGWSNTPAQHQLLERAIKVMAIAVIPLAISVHTVVSWIFAMTLRPGWNSSIYGPYFVVGAIYSGTAAVIVAMWVLRKTLRLEAYVEALHFRQLGIVLLVSTLLYLYFNINEYLTAGYKLESFERELLESLFVGRYAPLFWAVQIGGVLLPIGILAAVIGIKRLAPATIPAVLVSAVLAVVGAWIKRFLIVVPTLQTPLLPAQRIPAEWMHYSPTWVEWAVVGATFAGFLLAYTLLVRMFPAVSFWETAAAETDVAAPVTTTHRRSEGLGPATTTAATLVAALALTLPAHAATAPSPAPTRLVVTVERAMLPASTPTAATAPAPYASVDATLHHRRVPAGVSAGAVVVARLESATGAPLSFQPVRFTEKTTFGTISLGSRPTDANGIARLTVADRRAGSYAIAVAFVGSDEWAATRADAQVRIAERPAPALPSDGVLISPGPTFWIAAPFLAFFGGMWITFGYAFGYLVLWRMRRARPAN